MLPAPRSPDGRTIREDQPILAGHGGTNSIIPVTNPLERLNKEVKRRADVVGIFPGEAAIVRLIGAVLLEANDEWQLQHRYMQLEAMAELAPPLIEGEATPSPPSEVPPQAA
jgi:putative transposase